MSDHPGASEQRAFSDSELQWFAALSGDPLVDPLSSPSAREGHALRVALAMRTQELRAAYPDLDAATSEVDTARDWERLSAQLQSEGLLERPKAADPLVLVPPVAAAAMPPAPAPNVIQFPWWRRRQALVGLAASVLMAAVLVYQMPDRADYPEPPQMLGADGFERVPAAEPHQAAEQFAGQLRQAGLKPGQYQRGKSFIVDITLLASELPTAEPAFAAFGLKPAVGFNRLEFRMK